MKVWHSTSPEWSGAVRLEANEIACCIINAGLYGAWDMKEKAEGELMEASERFAALADGVRGRMVAEVERQLADRKTIDRLLSDKARQAVVKIVEAAMAEVFKDDAFIERMMTAAAGPIAEEAEAAVRLGVERLKARVADRIAKALA